MASLRVLLIWPLHTFSPMGTERYNYAFALLHYTFDWLVSFDIRSSGESYRNSKFPILLPTWL